MTNDVESGVSTTLVVISADPSRLSTLLQVGAKFMRKKKQWQQNQCDLLFIVISFYFKKIQRNPSFL